MYGYTFYEQKVPNISNHNHIWDLLNLALYWEMDTCADKLLVIFAPRLLRPAHFADTYERAIQQGLEQLAVLVKKYVQLNGLEISQSKDTILVSFAGSKEKGELLNEVIHSMASTKK
ncbi:hypothetical protein HDU93_005578 [Gonapodya sp. JEL0774]|nr:hypothetical protein HDU93_005578 [Gonapodya sp. JEL0774]